MDIIQDNVTNAFESCFWYSDALGRLAAANHTGFCRQTLIGGSYGLLNRVTYEPNPDYYTAKLFHDLAADEQLMVNISDNYGGYFRAYSYCSRVSNGSFGVVLINISPNQTVNTVINVYDSKGTGAVVSMNIYELTSTDGTLASRYMDMNGKTLMMDGDKLPCLVDCPRMEQGDNLTVKPYSIVFVDVDPADKNNICG